MEGVVITAIISTSVVWLLVLVVFIFCKCKGYLRVDHSDEDPYLFLELNKPIEHLEKEKIVILKVKKEDFIPRK